MQPDTFHGRQVHIVVDGAFPRLQQGDSIHFLFGKRKIENTTNNNEYLPLKRAIRHELGHYKQDVLKNAFNQSCAGHKIILEYHNIMINENTCADGPNNKFFQNGYRIGYELTIEKKDTIDASNALELLKKQYAQSQCAPLLEDMCSFVNNEENQKRLKDINNKLVQNMCMELQIKK